MMDNSEGEREVQEFGDRNTRRKRRKQLTKREQDKQLTKREQEKRQRFVSLFKISNISLYCDCIVNH